MHDNSLNFTFPLEHVSFQVSMVSTGRMVRSIPAHAHGRGCYEIHYIRHGSGTVVIDGVPRRVGQNTLYTTGPSILHEQIPDPSDPMVESCIYLRVFPDFEKTERGSSHACRRKDPKRASFLTPFLEQAFWMGQDTQQVLPLFDTIFQELEQKKLEAENSEIVDIVRGMSISLTELPLLFEKLKDGGTLGQSVPKSEEEKKEEN